MPRPRPFEAPVTRAVLPSMPRSIAPRSQSPERFTQLQRGRARFRYARRRSMGGHLAVTDIRDPATAERLACAHPDDYLRRRDFLARAAMTAGLAAGLSTVLDPDTLVAAAARRQKRA